MYLFGEGGVSPPLEKFGGLEPPPSPPPPGSYASAGWINNPVGYYEILDMRILTIIWPKNNKISIENQCQRPIAVIL